jgi:hypothetical protein
MADAVRSSAIRACNAVLPPLVGLLLRLGLGAGEFAAIARRIFVDAAARHLAEAGRKATHSQIAIITGLTRADVKRILETPAGTIISRPWEQHRASRVLRGWMTDAEFLSSDGQPRELPLRARRKSFATLTKRYSGDIPPRAMLNELVSMGAVEQRRNGLVRLVGNATRYAPKTRDIVEMGTNVRELMETLTTNLYREKPRLYVGKSARALVNSELLPFLQARVATTGTNFLEQIEDQLRHPPLVKQPKQRSNRSKVEFGVTVFAHEVTLQARRRKQDKTHDTKP